MLLSQKSSNSKFSTKTAIKKLLKNYSWVCKYINRWEKGAEGKESKN